MSLTPSEILHKEFDSKFRGYDPDQVNDFLDVIVAEFEKLTTENKEMETRMASMQDKLNYFQQLQDSLNNSIVVAQEAAERLKQNARKEAELILYEAEQEAEKRYEEAALKSKLLVTESENLRKYSLEFRERLINMVESQLTLINRSEYQDLFEQAEEDLEISQNQSKISVADRINEMEQSVQEEQGTLSMDFPMVNEFSSTVGENSEVVDDKLEEVEELKQVEQFADVSVDSVESVLGKTIRIDLPK